MCIILYNISNDFNILHADWNRDWNAELNTDQNRDWNTERNADFDAEQNVERF